MLPLEFDYLVDIIKKIPSISNKQAQKITKYLIDQNIENLEKNSALIFDYLKKIKIHNHLKFMYFLLSYKIN